MKYKKLVQNILISLISIVLCFLVVDFAIRTLNKIHFRSLFDVRARRTSNLNQKRIELLQQRFLVDIEREVIDKKTPLVVFVGDSITLGIPLREPEHAYPDMFDANIAIGAGGSGRIYARNISGPGGNIRDEAAVFRSVYEKYDLNIELMVFGYCLNDIFFSIDEGRGLGGLTREVLEDRKLKRRKVKDAHLHYYSQKENRDMVKESFRDISRTATEHGAGVLVVIFPYFTDFNKRSYRYRSIHEQVKKFAEESGLAVFDLLPVYSGYHCSAFMSERDSTHPNPLGHKFAADAIYKYVSSRMLDSLPDLKESPRFRPVADKGRAKSFCEAIYENESRGGITSCYKTLEDLIEKKRVYGGAEKRDRDSFYIDFDIPYRYRGNRLQ